MRLDKLTLIERETSKRLGGYHGASKVDGAGNYVSPSAERVTIIGDFNTIYSKARNITLINCYGVVIGASVANVMVVDTNDLIINESDVTYINGVKIKDGVVVQGDTNLIVDGGLNTLQNKFGCNIIERVDGGQDEVRGYNSAINTHIIDGSNNTA